ncbi:MULTISPECIES: hypothetical protein [Sinorhizobium]|uniref:hypothetical protein n=1 Tax=Sinorhizobium TaxID=28105 RepID=UPI00020F3C27|nr:hypothetical protein Sinme_2040 [Sinorhizobium meliloti AK83]
MPRPEDVDLSTSNVGSRPIQASVVAAALLLAACQSNPEPQEMARTSLQTAPADLQLLCANAVVAQAGGAKVLPMSSRQLDATSYSVDLDAAGRKFTCIVDSSGSVKSVQPA